MSRLSCDNTRHHRGLLPPTQASATSEQSHMELLPLPSNNRVQSLSVGSVRSPTTKFRTLVNKVINRNRACAAIKAVGESSRFEQGIDPRSKSAELRFGSQTTKCTIEVTHYSKKKCRTAVFTNAELVDWLKEENFPPRRKNEVRWINVGGISWDVIKALAIRYDLHPLSIEDVMAGTKDKSFKVDYYSQHLFAQLTSYRLQSEVDKDAVAAATKANTPSAFRITGRAKDHQSSHNIVPTIRTLDYDNQESPKNPPRSLRTQSSTISELGKSALTVLHPTMPIMHSGSSVENAVQALKLDSGTLDIESTRVFVFLLRDGTLLSIHQSPILYGAELKEQLNTGSITRTMEDVSMLFHGFLDLVVDHLIQIVDGYQFTILELERRILLKPTVAAVQTLHLISGDIELLKMSIKPLQRIVYGLRRYDLERCKALSNYQGGSAVGFLSEETKMYLTDIYDHIRFTMLSLETQGSTTRELISYTFNLTNYDSGNVMRRLLVVTVIFLPLMFITQYFGMNFIVMDSVKKHSDALFWKVVGPVILTFIIVAVRNKIFKLIISDH